MKHEIVICMGSSCFARGNKKNLLMTAAVIYLRWPRRTIVLTGPPYAAGRDKEFAEMLGDFEGKKVICGGTTANIVGRELGRAIHDDLRGGDGDIPPGALMARPRAATASGPCLRRIWRSSVESPAVSGGPHRPIRSV